MAAKRTPLELLIDFPRDGSSEERRDLMRLNTNSFIAAADRYGTRETEFFDLLFARVVCSMDNRLRRGLAMAMAKSGIAKEYVKKMLSGETSTVSPILRRSPTQTQSDILTTIRERTATLYKAPLREPSVEDTLSDGNRFTLPHLLLEEVYRYMYFSQRHFAARLKDAELLEVLDRTAKRFRVKIIEDSQVEIRDDILHGRKLVNDRVRRNTLNEDYLTELLQTSNSSEFTFALAALLAVDVTTCQRILNDTSWETLAVACRATKVSRSFFARLITGMHRRKSDLADMERIIGLYHKIPEDAAKRVMRFLQVRISSMEHIPDQLSTPQPQQEELPPMAAGFGKQVTN